MKVFKFFVIILVFSSVLWADWDVRWYEPNQWKLGISNFGKFGQSETGSDAGGFWPGGTDHNYIYGAGIWVGSILPNGDTVVAVGYDPRNSGGEFAPGLPYSDPNNPEWRVYFSTDSNYPLPVLSFLDSYCSYNEFDTLWHAPDTFHIKEPLGITVTRKTYAWPSSWYDDVVFVEYKIKNDTTYSLNNVYTGMCVDFDIGNEAGQGNDITGLDLSRKLGFGYQYYNEPGWDWTGKFGLKLLSDYSVAAFKRFTLDLEPQWDRERYLTLAGYNFSTGVYEPYDSIPPSPDDQRFVLSIGPYDLLPGDSLLIDYVVIGARDTLVYDTTDLKNKADAAQVFYNNYHIYGSHDVVVNYPNGGEVLSGNVTVNYNATSITGNPLQINILHSSNAGMSWTTIDSLLANTGTYNWNTANHPDGVLHRIGIFAFDSLVVGCDVSDGFFTIDNPGNTPPVLMVLSPEDSAIMSGNYDITWFARDPEFHDSLYINIYFKSQYDVTFQTIASNEPNDSIYMWHTIPYRNGSGTLIVETSDEEFTVAETVQVYLLNQISGGEIDHISGLNNCVDLSVLIHQAQQITGHTYELEFLQYRALLDGSYYYPEYIYEITDSNTGVTVLDTYSLKDGYTISGSQLEINDFSPIIDGFSIRAYTDGQNIISLQNFHNDSVKVVAGTYPEDSIILFGSGIQIWWAYRGSRLQLDWVTHTNGGLTLLVTDLDYGDAIPYKPYGFPLNQDSAFGWCFHWMPVGIDPSDTLRDNDKFIFLCGERIYFSRSVPPPEVGDRWVVYSSEYSPPIKGNVYRFTPYVGINENRTQISAISFQVYPVP
ncbi:hypothetical protein KAT67_04260, partial [candidate division WOR-3 bacterium]|nr:hypothetical protein [candidate division WOR-3 bacterium]